ncbi:hypothetical protein A0H76_1349 [Hepatospora eriocheir]|uniref:Tyrosine-protein phosphatase domain-containing protein n=1 Tax=Hepatospora eriocheir TaxID=1081669 RepID=A0A1X0QH85_9MICR|nr:hypothetical protein A0H76_1349 [Hepatospora eriocheir]
MTEDRKIAFENIRLVLLKYAKRLDFREMIKLLNDTGSHFCIPPTDYDRFEKVTPYSREVSLRYKTNYVNASFVDRFITCQNPKEDHFETFYSFISKSEISLIIALEYNISYLNDYEILIENKIFRVDLIDLSKENKKGCLQGMERLEYYGV